MSQSQQNNPSRPNGMHGAPPSLNNAPMGGYFMYPNYDYQGQPGQMPGHMQGQMRPLPYNYPPHPGYAGFDPSRPGPNTSRPVPRGGVSPSSDSTKLASSASQSSDRKADAVSPKAENSQLDNTSTSGSSSESNGSSVNTPAPAATVQAPSAAPTPAPPAAASTASAPPASAPAPASSPSTHPFMGKTMDLISKVKIRYTGTLCNIDSVNSTVALQNVSSYGTEGRVKPGEGTIYPASSDIYEYLVFNSGDIENLYLRDDLAAPPAAAAAPQDPAIVSSGKRVADSKSSRNDDKAEETGEYDIEAANQKFAELSLESKDMGVTRVYDKTKSFFDDLSVERPAYSAGSSVNNVETFGSAAVRRGRGRGRGRGGPRHEGHRNDGYRGGDRYGGDSYGSVGNDGYRTVGNDGYRNDNRSQRGRRDDRGPGPGHRGGRGGHRDGHKDSKPRVPYFTNKFD